MPLIGDFHFNGHKLLSNYPGLRAARSRSTGSIPATSAAARKHDPQFAVMIERAIDYGKPVRIGVNWGSLDQDLLGEPDGRERALGQSARRRRT